MITNPAELNQETLKAEMEQIARRVDLETAEDALYFPKYFQFETIRVCDAKCPFCAIDKWDKSVPVIPDKLFEKIVSELAQYADWIEAVCIQRAGEPLLDKKLGARIRRLKEIGIKKITMSTNASLLSEKKATEILDAGLDDIMLSIDSVDKKIYESLRVGLNFENVMSNIVTLFEVRDRIKPELIVRVRGVSMQDLSTLEGRREVLEWETFWDKYKKPHDRIYMKQLHNWGNQVDVEKKTEGGLNAAYGDIYHPCILPWSTMHITTMGIVALCPMDYDAKFAMGDLNKETIADIWHNEKWAKIRKLHSTGERNQIDMCRGCKLFDLDFSLENKLDRKELFEG